MPEIPTAVPETSGNEIFRFVSVRPVQPLNGSAMRGMSVSSEFYQSIAPVDLEAIDTSESLLYVSLIDALEDADAIASMYTAVETFRASNSNYHKTISEINEAYPGLSEIMDYLISQDFSVTGADFQTAVEAGLITGTIADYITDTEYLELKLRLWDNLFAEVVKAKNYHMQETISSYIRILNLFELVEADSDFVATADGFKKIALGFITLPSPIFPLPVPSPDIDLNLEEPDDLLAENIAAAKLRVKAYIKAKDEIIKALELQHLSDLAASKQDQWDGYVGMAQKLPTEAPPDFAGEPPFDNSYLRNTTFNNLTEETKDILTIELNISSESAHVPSINQLLNSKISIDSDIINSELQPGGGELISIGNVGIVVHNWCISPNYTNTNPCSPWYGASVPTTKGFIKPIGFGDLLLVKQKLLKYKMGEIAHVENVMMTERKNRENRKLKRVEETFTTEELRYSETETETQTTERFSMERESSNVIQSSQENQSTHDGGFGVSITGSYGPVSATATYTNSSSNTQVSNNSSVMATRAAQSYAKDISNRALKGVIEQVRLQRSRTTIDEVLDVNSHGFDNTEGTGHVTGIYHWLDKFYLSQVYNYGKRLMFEFMIPEPAAFYIFSQVHSPAEKIRIIKPIALEKLATPIKSFNDIHIGNYAHLAALYNVSEISPPPEDFTYISKGYNWDANLANPGWQMLSMKDNDLVVPEGYGALSATLDFVAMYGWVQGRLGTNWFNNQGVSGAFFQALGNKTGVIPFSFITPSGTTFCVNVTITCAVLNSTITKWKISVYNALKDAYIRQLADYEDKLAAMENPAFGNMKGNNPGRNLEIIQEELKRASLSLLTGQKFDAFDAMQNNQTHGYPDFKAGDALAEGDYVKFFEHNLEWNNMTYYFYPYFWGRKKNWTLIKSYEDSDPLFTKFLQAGYVRVMIPARLTMSEMLLSYLQTGQIWFGGTPPLAGISPYTNLVAEIQQALADETNQVITTVGDPWMVKVPTDLVLLQKADAVDLPDFTATITPSAIGVPEP